MNRTVFRLAAWLVVLAVAVFTLSPIEMRPTLDAPPDIERLAAFALMGAAFCLGYPKHRWKIILLVVAVAGALEILQHVVPGRHGRLHDFNVKAFAAVVGVVLAMLIEQSVEGVQARSR
jgi:VanZ family protein